MSEQPRDTPAQRYARSLLDLREAGFKGFWSDEVLPFESHEEAVEWFGRCLAHSDETGVTVIKGISGSDDEPDEWSYVICVVGNGPGASTHAQFIAMCHRAVPVICKELRQYGGWDDDPLPTDDDGTAAQRERGRV